MRCFLQRNEVYTWLFPVLSWLKTVSILAEGNKQNKKKKRIEPSARIKRSKRRSLKVFSKIPTEPFSEWGKLWIQTFAASKSKTLFFAVFNEMILSRRAKVLFSLNVLSCCQSRPCAPAPPRARLTPAVSPVSAENPGAVHRRGTAQKLVH